MSLNSYAHILNFLIVKYIFCVVAAAAAALFFFFFCFFFFFSFLLLYYFLHFPALCHCRYHRHLYSATPSSRLSSSFSLSYLTSISWAFQYFFFICVRFLHMYYVCVLFCCFKFYTVFFLLLLLLLLLVLLLFYFFFHQFEPIYFLLYFIMCALFFTLWSLVAVFVFPSLSLSLLWSHSCFSFSSFFRNYISFFSVRLIQRGPRSA